MCKNCVHCNTDENFLFDSIWLCFKSQKWVKYSEEKILRLSTFVQKLQLKQGDEELIITKQ